MLKKTTPDEQLENARREAGYKLICGVDEAGRGPLSGPVVAAACILPAGCEIPGLNDSKKLTPKQRDRLFDTVREVAVAYSVGQASPEEIDELNILKATHLAMHRAVAALEKVEYVLVDGLPVPGFPCPCENMVKGDARCASIAAASIVAKVCRDELMEKADLEFPGYGFALHKGYGTRAHLEALRKLGVSPIHRRSFAPVRALLGEQCVQMELF